LPASVDWRPEFVGAADEARATYRSAAGSVDVYLNVYGQQKPGQELVYYQNSLITKRDWEWMAARTRAPQDPPELTYAEAGTRAGERWVLAHGYKVGARMTSNPALAQLYYGATALFRPQPAGVIALAARCEKECNGAHERIAAFWRARSGAFRELIPTVLAGERNAAAELPAHRPNTASR
jgi:EpsI family protein